MKPISRLLSFLLALCILVGLCPVLPTEAAPTSEQQATAEALNTEIEAILNGDRYSKYVQYTIPTGTSNGNTVIKDAKAVVKDLDGERFILVDRHLQGDAYYAFDPSTSSSYSQYGLDQVSIQDKQLFGANPDAAILFQYHSNSGSESTSYENVQNYRVGFHLKTKNDRYLHISNGTDSLLTMKDTEPGKSLSVLIRTSNLSIYNSGSFISNNKSFLRFYHSGTSHYAASEYSSSSDSDPSTQLLLFKERSDRVNIEPLYDAIMEAEAYLLNYNPREEDNYDAFISALETAITTYGNYNKSTYSDDVTEAEADVNTKAEALTLATYRIKSYADQLAQLPIPTTKRLKTSDTISTGTYFVLGWDDNGYYRAMNHASHSTYTTSGNLTWDVYKIAPLQVKDGKVRANNLNRAVTILKAKDAAAPYRYSMMFSNGNFLSMDKHDANGKLQALDGANQAGLQVSATPQLLEIGKHANSVTNAEDAFYIGGKEVNDTFYLNYGDETNTFRAWRLTTGVGAPISYDMFLYQVSPLTVELYRSLVYVKQYVDNSNGLYDKEQFALFMKDFRRARDLYLENMNTWEDTTKQEELDTLAAKLKAWPEQLTITSPTAQYVDIPIEILDFRSDRFLFEFYSGSDGYRYALSNAIAQTDYPTGDPLLLPLYEAMEANTKRVKMGNTYIRVGMLLPDLVEGNPTYAEHTVGFIAARILKEWMHDPNSSLHNTHASEIAIFNRYLENVDTQDVIWNTAKSFYTAYHTAGKTQAEKEAILGSFKNTVAKTLTGKNGGDLPWEEVTTVFDLAYYALNNIWRPVSDTLGVGKEPYNIVVPERDTLRMYLDQETGLYTIDSANRTVYNGYRIYNTVPFVENGHLNFPKMLPVNGLGFEKNNTKDTDPTTNLYTRYGWEKAMKDVNFGFMIHASGTFVYYEGQEQKFDFVGDDDVYFFINGKLVMDLGGTHSPAGGSLLLSEANTKYNLGLEDEGVYSFDMFYAERHTFSSNMKFSTNIKIVNPEAVTTKGQYIVQMGGADATDPITGKGSPVADNTGVFVGDIMAYSFDLQNTMDVPLVNVRMEDPTLGVSLSPTYIGTYEGQVDGQTVTSLTDPDADHANGVVTRFDNLLLEYRTLDTNNKPVSQPVQSLSAGRMLDLLTLTADRPEGAQNWKYTSLPEGCYRVRVENADELSALLQAGIPTKCSFSLYGFLRKVKSTDTPYINELTTHCDYPRSSHIDAEYSTVTGKASRMIRALENSNMPQVRKLEVVLDYGKAVAIPLEDIVDLVHFEDGSPARVGEVIGFVGEGYNGQVLKKLPVGMFCTETGDTMQKEQGFFSRRATDLTFTPDQFLDRIHGLFAVIAIEDFYYGTETTEQFHYVLAQIALTPAHVMYYETDFAPNIFTLTQAGSFEDVYERENDVYQEWSRIEDQSGSADPYQDYSRLANTVYGTEIDREGVPSDAFFADFTGDGYDRRYRDNPLYNGLDFDLTGTSTGTNHAKYWVVNTGNANYATIDHTTGTLSFTMKSLGKSAYVQTGISLNNATTTPIYLHPGREDMAQVRFKLKNFKIDSDNNDPWFRLYFSDGSGSLQYVQVPFPEAYLNNEQYYTVTIPMTDVYSSLPSIDRLRVQLFNVNSISASAMGVMTIDYIYVGPTAGLPEKLYQNYLLFTFDRSAGDTLRYGSSIYGGTDFNNVGNWSTDIASSKGSKLEIKNGCLTFTDNIDLNGTAGYTYNYFHSGSTDSKTPLVYTPGSNDVCQVRVRISNGNVISGKTPDLCIEALNPGVASNKSFNCGKETFVYNEIKGKFHTFTIPLNESSYLNLSRLASIRPSFHNIQGATFEVDYIYVGPEHMLSQLSRDQDPNTPTYAEAPHDHLFFDFTHKDRDLLRYSNVVYNNPVCNHPDCTVANCQNQSHLLNGSNYDLRESWSTDTATSITGIDTAAGTITFMDSDAEKDYNYIHSAPEFQCNQLNFTHGAKDHLLVRMKITGGSCVSGRLTLSLENEEGAVPKMYGKATFPASDYMDGNYHVFTVPLNMEDYLKAPLIKGVRPVISGTQGCTFTVDYIYVGPLTEGNPGNSSLYFGFGNTGEDQQRYTAISYGEFNYDRWEPGNTSDVANWATGYGPSGTQGRPSGTGGDFSIDNSSGTITVYPPSFVSFDDNEVYRVDLMPAKTSRKYEYSTSTNLPLHYRPDRAGLIQIRLKIENCEDGSEDDKFVNDAGWNESQGDRYDVPALDVRVNYLKDGVHKVVNPHTYWTSLDITSPEYQIITIPLKDHLAEADYVDGIDVRFWHIKSKKSSSGEDIGKIVIDYIYMGPGKIAPEPVYGYDSSYLNDTELSNGSSFVVTGQGVKTQFQTDKYTEASFSFRGTGFDIISRTDMNQGSIRVEVWKKGADKSKDKAVKTLTVNNKGELELFQIPVVSVQGLPYGDYDVTLWVNAPIKTPYEFLNHKGNFHFDAVRIYDPMGEDTGLAPEVLFTYLVDTEGYASVKEVRNILLSSENFASQLTGSGAIFVDSAEEPTVTVPATDNNGETIPGSTAVVKPDGIDVNGHITASVTTYDKIGPKNEVYLAPGQAVAFMLKISTEYVPTSVDVGVKTIKANEPANLVAGIVTKGNATHNGLMEVAGRRDVTIRSATAQYYALPIDANTFFTAQDNNRYCYIVLYNNGTAGTVTNVLSVTDIKVAYDKEPEIGLPQDAVTDKEIQKRSGNAVEPYYDFVVDSHTLEAAALVMKAVLETPLLAEGTKLMHSLNLASDISVNYAVTMESMAGYDSFYLEVKIPGREDALRIDPVEKGYYYYFTLEGLTAVQMNDTLEATLYMEKNGRIYRSETDIYSIAQYAYTQLGKDTVADELKALCAELLRYGSAAQIFKGYRTNALADDAMTEEQRAYLTDLSAVTFGNTNRQLADLSNPTAKWLGKSLILDSKVTLRYVVDLTAFETVDNITLRVRYRDYAGAEQTAVLTEAEPYGSVDGYYSFDFSGLLAAELRTVLQAAVYAGDTQISNTLEYSVDTYGNNKTGTLDTLCRALMAYSDDAKTFFAK